VYLEPDRTFGEVPDRGDGLEWSERRRTVEALAYLPGFLFVAHRALQVAARHVEADGVAEYVLERAVAGNVAATLIDGRDPLDLVVIIFGQRVLGVIDCRVCLTAFYRSI